ncbi:MAG: DUF4097 family beta strand repeat-containing protein [Clostridia bacterium]|nr:DUF4097 family beta strand repeat-containing protein [Clostridia bacterium]
MKKGSVIAAIVLIAVGIIVFGAAFVASGFSFSKLDTANYETNTYTLSEKFEMIEIESDEADITFKPSEGEKTRVDCVVREKVKHAVSVENDTLKITAVDKRAWYDHLASFSFKPQSVTVYLPSEHYTALTIATHTGDVTVPNLFSFGDTQITASTGDIAFDASLDGSLNIKTSTGSIRIHGVHAENIDLSVSTGKIEGENIHCQETLSFQVSTGKTELTDVLCKMLLSTGSTGGVTLKNVTATDDFNIVRDTGDVRFESCEAGRITIKTSTGDVTGTLRSEKVFLTKTSTGNIKVPDTASGGRCEITTSTGDISITINSR